MRLFNFVPTRWRTKVALTTQRIFTPDRFRQKTVSANLILYVRGHPKAANLTRILRVADPKKDLALIRDLIQSFVNRATGEMDRGVRFRTQQLALLLEERNLEACIRRAKNQNYVGSTS
jgi:hypothetical protein